MMANLKVLTVSLLAILTVGAANAEIASKGYVDRIVGGIDIPTVPTKTSQLTNDSGYITSAALPTVDSALSTTSENAVQNKVVTTALNNKVGSVTEGSANGTISVDGTDVAVHGLGAMAYKTWGDMTNYADSSADYAASREAGAVRSQLLESLNAKVNIAQTETNAKKVMSTNSTGNVVASSITGDGSVTVTVADSGAITITGAETNISGKADKAYIQAGTATKITYNNQGIVTGGTTLSASDIPTIEQSQVNGLATALAGKANTSAIPTATSQLTNDSGFLTSHNPVDTALSADSTNAVQNKVVTAALNTKANAADVYAKDAVDSMVNAKANAADVYTKDAVDSMLAGKVPTSRTVNGKALSGDITLSASDVGAVAANTAIAASTANSIVQYDADGLVVSGTPAGSLATKSTVVSADITDGTIVDADINASANIAQSKISGLTTALANARNQIPSGSENNAAASATIWVE